MGQSEQKLLKGIGGWLILPLLGLILSPLIKIYMIYEDLWPIFSPDYWDDLTSPTSELYHPLWSRVLIFEVAGNVTIFLLGLAALVSFLKKSRKAPRLVIMWLLLALVFVAADSYFRGYIPGAVQEYDNILSSELLRAGIPAAIWIPYFLISKRVKATFVN
jgi:VanZ family protein